jgi:cell division protein FtsQ
VSPSHAPRAARRGRRFWAGVAAGVVVVALVLAGGAYVALHSSLFSVTTVTVSGEHHETADEVLAASGLRGDPSMASVNTAAVAQRIEASFPWVATADVVTHWPHTVSITIVERRAVAIVHSPAGAASLVDVTGRELGAPRPNEALPSLQFAVVKGSPGSAGTATQLPAAAEPGLLVAASLPRAFKWQVDTIVVDPRGQVTLRMNSPVTFELGFASNLGAKYEAIAAIIEHATLHAGDVVDVSVPQATTVSGP